MKTQTPMVNYMTIKTDTNKKGIALAQSWQVHVIAAGHVSIEARNLQTERDAVEWIADHAEIGIDYHVVQVWSK